MPGLSFLFKKKFHPARIDRQKEVFIAEQTVQERKERDKQMALEAMKEREQLVYETLALGARVGLYYYSLF